MMFFRCGFLALVALTLSGCAGARSAAAFSARSFRFEQDTFAFANELKWEYRIDPSSEKMTGRPRRPPPDYTLHCFVLVRTARQFFDHARFDPSQPRADAATYRRLIRQVVTWNPRKAPIESERVTIPGYANLREFSREKEALLKAECGGAWQSYFQRGHWRMIFPFSRPHQEHTAEQLMSAVDRGSYPIVHVVSFPTLAINHALLVFAYSASKTEILFEAYDPNDPGAPRQLHFERGARTFFLPRNNYFSGGKVDVYEIYHRVNY